MPLKDLKMERKRDEEFEETLRYRLWVKQSGFSLGFLSQNGGLTVYIESSNMCTNTLERLDSQITT